MTVFGAFQAFFRLGSQARHGVEIRQAVKAWERRFSEKGDFSEAELALIAERRAQRERRSTGAFEQVQGEPGSEPVLEGTSG